MDRTPFAETELLLDALNGDTEEVLRRIAEMLPHERMAMADICDTIASLCRGANR